jgi:glucose/arabinose dehydrogenase
MRRVWALALCVAMAGAAASAAVTVSLDPVASGFIAPILVTHSGDSRIFVMEQGGTVKIVDGGGAGIHTTFLDISPEVFFSGERGLLGMAFHPDWDGTTERRFYVHYVTFGGAFGQGISRVSEFQTQGGNPDLADAGSEVILFSLDQPQGNHNGGMIAFGPESPERHLYIALGDGGGGNDDDAGHTPVIGNSQDTTNAFGTILRLDVDSAPDSGLNYHVPATNPFAGSGTDVPEIFAWGLRNPYRFSFDRGTGTLLCGDIGQGAWEEVDIISLGDNLGWRNYEGTHEILGPPIAGTTFPIHEYPHSAGNDTVIGGFVYRGTANPGLAGMCIFGDYGSGRIWALAETAPGVWSGTSQEIGTLGLIDSLLSFGEDSAGEIYACSVTGDVFRINDTTIPAGITLFGTYR